MTDRSVERDMDEAAIAYLKSFDSKKLSRLGKMFISDGSPKDYLRTPHLTNIFLDLMSQKGGMPMSLSKKIGNGKSIFQRHN